MTWTLAPSLATLRNEINTKWPHRSKTHDGEIGNRAHQKRKSEHNPDSLGVVRAIDITAAGIDAHALVQACIGDSRVHYVIYDGTIWSRTYSWSPKPYTGQNKHRQHVHISLRNRTSETAPHDVVAEAATDTRSWLRTSSPARPAPTAAATNPGGLSTAQVEALQKALNRVFPRYSHLAADGIYGPRTKAVVAEFQRRHGHGLHIDGIAGPRTRAALKNYGIVL